MPVIGSRSPPKDVPDLAAPVLRGEQSIMQGVQNGMFCPMATATCRSPRSSPNSNAAATTAGTCRTGRASPTANRRRVKAPRSMFSGASNISVLSMRSSPQVRRPRNAHVWYGNNQTLRRGTNNEEALPLVGTLLAIVLVAAACGDDDSSSDSADSSDSASTEEEAVEQTQGGDLTFHMITHSDDGPFWSVVKRAWKRPAPMSASTVVDARQQRPGSDGLRHRDRDR